VPYIHTPPYTIHHFTPYPQFSEGMQVAPKDTSYETIKDSCMAIFRTMGHDPQTRNSRPPCYLIIRCKSEDCSAGCGVSCNQRDAWFTTFWRERSCTARCHTSIHHLLSIHHTPPHAIPAANFHSNPFMQRPLQQLQGANHPYTTSSAYTIHHLTSQQCNCQITCQTTQGGAGALPKHSNGSNC
jgi:hypothetical protein